MQRLLLVLIVLIITTCQSEVYMQVEYMLNAL